MGKDFLGLADLSRAEIEALLDSAAAFRRQVRLTRDTSSVLRGWTVANLFFEPSTRTQVSFELAARRLGAEVINLQVAQSSVAKGESLIDTARTLEALGASVLVLRHRAAGAPHLVARHVSVPVVNAGDGAHEHPTQGLLDLLTVRDRLGTIQGRHVAIVGDIRHSRVARSDIWGFTRLGARVTLVGPPPLVPLEMAELGVRVSHDLEAVLPTVDVLYVLRIQRERQNGNLLPSLGAYRKHYGVDLERLRRARPDLVVMHPGPANVGVEITGPVLEHPRSAVAEQVANGVAVRMAVLARLAEARRHAIPA